MKKIILIAIFIFCLAAKANAAPRYISLAPSTTEILFALGLDEEIIGVSTFCNFPGQVKNRPKVGDFSSPNLERIISLKPDYIFCTGLEQAPVIWRLKELNFKVYVADPASFEELFKSIEEIAQITKRQDKARALIWQMKSAVNEVASKAKLIPNEKKVRVFLEIWHEPLMTAGKGSFVDELIFLSGGINIAHNTSRPYSNYSSEKVISSNPQCIIMAYMDQEPPLRLVKQRFGWNKIEAVKNGRVFNDINPDILLRPGPRLILGLKQLYKKFYPE